VKDDWMILVAVAAIVVVAFTYIASISLP